MTKRRAEETRRLDEAMSGGEPRSDLMEDKRGGVEDRKADKKKQGGDGAGRQAQATSQAGNTYIK